MKGFITQVNIDSNLRLASLQSASISLVLLKAISVALAAAVYQQKCAVAGGSSSDASLGGHNDFCNHLDVQLVWHAKYFSKKNAHNVSAHHNAQ